MSLHLTTLQALQTLLFDLLSKGPRTHKNVCLQQQERLESRKCSTLCTNAAYYMLLQVSGMRNVSVPTSLQACTTISSTVHPLCSWNSHSKSFLLFKLSYVIILYHIEDSCRMLWTVKPLGCISARIVQDSLTPRVFLHIGCDVVHS